MEFWNRKFINDRTRHLIGRLPVGKLEVLEISGEAWRDRFEWKSYEVFRYPDYDLRQDVIPGRAFDLIIAEQVFEHLRSPHRAARNVFRMLKSGGHFLVTTSVWAFARRARTAVGAA